MIDLNGSLLPARWHASMMPGCDPGFGLLSQVLDALPAGVVAIDRHGTVLVGNDYIREMSSGDGDGGISRVELRHSDGRPYEDDERPIIAALQTGNRVVGRELDVQDSQGRTRFLLANAVPLLDGEGEIALVVAAYFDIILQKRAELRAAEDRKRQEALLDTLRTALQPPHLPSIPGAHLAARYHAAMQDIGGDFYDVFPLRGQSSGLVVGDVCGQGPDAAVVTSLVRYTLRGAAMSTRRPGEALDLVNEALLDAETDRFCTAVFARIRRERDSLHVHLARAGHPFPLVKRRGGGVHALQDGGALLGVVGRLQIEEEHLILAPGDVLVLVTDGVTEALDANGAELGWEGVAEILDEVPPEASPDDIAEELRSASARNGANDDVAIVAVQAKGPSLR